MRYNDTEGAYWSFISAARKRRCDRCGGRIWKSQTVGQYGPASDGPMDHHCKMCIDEVRKERV